MNQYQLLITKIQFLKTGLSSSTDFTPEELKIITEALETIQFLEIIFKARANIETKQLFNELTKFKPYE